MTREETVKIIRIMVDSYPNYKPNNISETVDVWQMMLSDYDYNLVAMALKAYILSDTSGFAPSIGQLVAKIQTLTKPKELSEMEAWSLVNKAIGNSSYDYVNEFYKLPPIIQKCVGNSMQLHKWAMTENLNKEVVSSNFMRSYRTMVARQEEYMEMPQEIRDVISSVSNNLHLPQNDTEDMKTINTSHDEEKLKIEALDEQRKFVPMPSNIKKRLEEFRNEQSKKATY